MRNNNFIGSAIKRPGQLHRDLGVPEGQTIPQNTLRAAAEAPGKVGQRARFAQTLEGINPKKSKPSIARAAAGR